MEYKLLVSTQIFFGPVEFFANSHFLAIFQHLKNSNECCRADNELKMGGRPYFGMYFHKKNRRKNWRTPPLPRF